MSLLAALEVSLLFVCIWGLIAVLLTGQFNTIVILACIAAVLFGYLQRRKGWRPTPLIANIAALLVFLAAGVIFLTSLNLLIATVYLFLFLQVTKYVTRQSLAEIRWCYLISLFHVIGASVITTAITFGFMLLVYVFLVLISLRLYVMARDWESSAVVEHAGAPQKKHKRWLAWSSDTVATVPAVMPPAPRGFLRSSVFLTLLISLMAGALFSAIPRLATQNLFQAYGPAPEEPAVSAFSENVEFGSFTEIQQDDAVALFVQPVGDEKPAHVRMRGVALDTFDGKAWRRTNSYINTGSRFYEFQPIFTTRLYPEEYTYRIIQPPGVTNFLFGDSFPISIKIPGPFQFSADRMAQAIYLDEMPPKEFQYEVHSMHEDLGARRDPAKANLISRPVDNLKFSTEFDWPSEDGLRGDFNRTVDRWGAQLDDLTSGVWPIFPRQDEDEQSTETGEAALETTEVWDEEEELAEEEETEEDREDYHDPTQFMSEEDRERFRNYRRQRFLRRFMDSQTTDSEQTTFTRDVDEFDRFSYWGHRRDEFRARTPQQRLHRYLTKCLEVPESLATGRVPEMAVEWTEDEETTFSKAIAVERRLRTEFGYTLTPTAKGNFIEDFLFEVREGHCEYFATSMAVLLRNVGIPARVVNGFYSSEWNAISGNFTVRQRDAHSWVEAWMGDEYGWMTFDPTPPAGVSRRADSPFMQGMLRVMDAVRVRWYRYVVDYSINDQVSMIRQVMQWRRALMDRLQKSEIIGVSADERITIELGDFSGEIDWRPVALAAIIIFLLVGWQLTRWITRRRSRRFSDVRFYDELLKLLSKRGIFIKPGQTPMEFAQDVANENAQWQSFVRATALYYARRYHEASLQPEEFRLISDLKKSLRAKKQ